MYNRSDLLKLCAREYTRFVAATGFLSIISLPGNKQLFSKLAHDKVFPPLRGEEYFPLVGLLLAGLLALLTLILAAHVPQLVLAALLLVGLVLLTGGLHLDGLMDSCDGLFGGFTRERKLDIMRDSRVGSFGVLGGACALLLKFSCFASIDPHLLPIALLVTLPSARWSMVLLLYLFPNARAAGLGATFHQAISVRKLAMACGLTLVIVLLSGQLSGLFIWCAITLASLLAGAWISRQLGGLTGDTYGAIAELAEVIGLLAFVLLHFS